MWWKGMSLGQGLGTKLAREGAWGGRFGRVGRSQSASEVGPGNQAPEVGMSTSP